MNETQRNIKRYKAALPGLRERIIASAMLLVISLSLVVSATFAWYTISTAPEVSMINTTIAANGNLEIALVGRFDEDGNVLPPDTSKVGDSLAAEGKNVMESNITWGNLVNLSDHRYGLNEISLRPALLRGYGLDRTPLYGAVYSSDGRIVEVSQAYEYATWTEMENGDYYFAAGDASTPGVRAIASVVYTNVTGDAKKAALETAAGKAFSDAEATYVGIITSDPNQDGTHMAALIDLIELFVNEKAANVLGSKTEDYSSVVTGMYNLMVEYEKILQYEGEALRILANMQIYLQDASKGTNYYEDVDKLIAAYKNGELTRLNVKLESIQSYVKNKADLYAAMYTPPKTPATLPEEDRKSVQEWAMLYDPSPENTNRPSDILPWVAIQEAVNRLVNVGTTEINGLPMSQFGGSKIGEIMGILNAKEHRVVIKSGILKETEDRIGKLLQKNVVRVDVEIREIMQKTIEGVYVTTLDEGKGILLGKDQGYSVGLSASGSGGDATAQDTYGMGIDMWFRTNKADSMLRLEGGFRYSDTPVQLTGKDKNGNEDIPLFDLVRDEKPVDVYFVMETPEGATEELRVWYTSEKHEYFGTDAELAEKDYMNVAPKLTLDGEEVTGTDSNGNAVKIYTAKKSALAYRGYMLEETVDDAPVNNWYDSTTHLLIGNETELKDAGFNITEVMYNPIIGYEGPNRVWMDWESLIANGYMPEDSTTQGSGSCYVFYATPSDQTRILELLKAFTVTFIDREGNVLATARLDTDNAYAINGKVTVPLVLVAGAEYEDEAGATHFGITTLAQNEETWITAIVYLDGVQLTNEQVLSAGEIEGRLNLQFGSNAVLDVADDRGLQKKQFTVSAVAQYGDAVSTKETERITIPYGDGSPKKIQVTVTVDGDKPNTMNAAFIRSIGRNQGSRMDTVEFKDNNNGTWSAEFELTKPGTYSLRSIIADGVEYDLADRPTVVVEGMTIMNVYCSHHTSGEYMLTDTYVDVPVVAEIQTDDNLQLSTVRALFRSAEGKEYTALLSYDSREEVWKGSARITSSGTYELKEIVIDGEPFELPTSVKPIVLTFKLGLKARIWCTNLDEFREATKDGYDPEKSVDIDVTMEIVDDSNNQIKDLDAAKLYYLREGSPLEEDGMDTDLTWDPSSRQYKGTMHLPSAGRFYFDRIVITQDGAESTISRAEAPTFSVRSQDPPTYIGFEPMEYQYTGGSGGAKLVVKLKDAAATTIWGLIENVNGTGPKLWVPGVTVSEVGSEGSYSFLVPTNLTGAYVGKQDGQWQLTEIAIQDVEVRNDVGELVKEYPVTVGADGNPVAPGLTGTAVDENHLDYYKNHYYVLDASNCDVVTDENVTYVVETVNVKVVKGSSDMAYTGTTFGQTQKKDENGNGVVDAAGKPVMEVTGTFMQEHTDSGLVVTITDWNGRDIQNVTDVMLLLTYDDNWTEDYGSYTVSKDVGFVDQQWKISSTEAVNDADGNLVYTKHKAADGKFQGAGKYTVEVRYKVNGTEKINATPIEYYVWSRRPTVKISSVNTNLTTDRYYTTTGPTSKDGMLTGSFNSKIDDFNAVVYMYVSAQSGLYDHECLQVKYPTVTLSVNGIPATHKGITMTFAGSTPIEFESGKLTSKAGSIGKGTNGTYNTGYTGLGFNIETYPRFEPAGKQTVDQITVVYNNDTYTVSLSDAVTINNPLCPPFVDFKVNDSTFTGEVPGRLIAECQTDGSYAVTLPKINSWDVNGGKPLSSLPTDLSAETPSTSTAKYAQYSGGRINGTWTKYDVTTKVYTAIVSSQTWKTRHEVIEWKTGSTTYKAGEKITITGPMTLTAVVDTSYKHSIAESNETYKRTVITIVTTTESGKSYNRPSGYTNAAPPTAGDSGWVLQN